MKRLRFFVILGCLLALSLAFTACKGGAGGPPGGGNQTPVAGDYDVSGNLAQTAGSVTAVTVTAKEGKSPGAVTVLYNGSATIPQTAGSYPVTFNVAAATGWNAASGLSAGTLEVNDNPTPVVGDYDISGNLTQTAGNVTAITVTAKEGKSPGAVTVLYNGSEDIPQTFGSYPVTFDVAAATGWNAANGLSAGTLTVNNKATPTVTTWPTAETITYGAALSTSELTGGVGPGTFAWTHGDTIPTVTNNGYDVTFTPTDTANFNTLTHNVAITVNKADPDVTWPTGLTAQYGQTLSDVSLESYTNDPAGTFSWTTPGTSVGALGPQSHSMTFTPDTGNYNTATKNDVSITVNKADPTVTWPTAATITYGVALSTSVLTGSTASVEGTFAWKNGTVIPTVTNSGYEVTFTPTDTTNYNTLTHNVAITVNKADPAVSWPTATAITYGAALSASELTGGVGSGTFAWTDGTTIPAVTNSGYEVTFTPTDTANYNTLTHNVAITVNKANPTVTWPSAAAIIYGQTLAVAVFTGGSGNGVFAYTNATLAPTVADSGTAYEVTFTPANTANYNTLTQNVAITVNKADPVVTWPSAASITYGAALSTSALTGGVGNGSFAWTNGAIIPTVFNSGYEVTFTPSDNANFNTLTQNIAITVQSFMEMVNVGAGIFQQGQNGNGSSGNIENARRVTLTQGFYIGKYEVTQEQYQTVMGTNPSYFTTDADAGETQSRRPVEQISWYAALVFCNKLSIAEGLTPAYRINNSTDPAVWGNVPTNYDATWNDVTIESGSTGYRLPTEAQWEYAAKGGTLASTPKKIYSGSDTVGDVAWYTGNSGSKTHEVGKKAANELGLYDMSGNVSEWCWDRESVPFGGYPWGEVTDPMGRSSGGTRVIRGGSCYSGDYQVRSVYRDVGNPNYTYDNDYGDCGFRVVRP